MLDLSDITPEFGTVVTCTYNCSLVNIISYKIYSYGYGSVKAHAVSAYQLSQA